MKIFERLGVLEEIEPISKELYNKIIKASQEKNNKISKILGDKTNGVIHLFDYNIHLNNENIKLKIELSLIFYSIKKTTLVNVQAISAKGLDIKNKKLQYTHSKLHDLGINLNIYYNGDTTYDQVISVLKKQLKESIISHELKHIYDGLIRPESLENRVEYESVKFYSPITAISDFLFLVYYTSNAENSVRPNELYNNLINSGVTKDNFYDTIKSNEIIEKLNKCINLNFEEFKQEILKDPKSKPFIEEFYSKGFKSSGDISKDILNLLFINIYNGVLSTYSDRMQKYFFRYNIFGDPNQIDKLNKTLTNQYNKFSKKYENYTNDPEKYFEYLIKKLNFVAEKMKRKLYKIYDMMPEEKKSDRKSILNWDIYTKSKMKKEGLDVTYKKPALEFKKFGKNK